MRTLSILTALSYILALTGCPTVTAKYDYDIQTDFSRLQTFRWQPLPGDMQIDELTERRIKKAVNKQLRDKRLIIVSSNPDFLISLHLKKQIKKEMVDWSYPSVPYGSYWGGRVIESYKYEEETLALDFIDTRTKRLRWTGSTTLITEQPLSPQKRTDRINEAVSKILDNFPPS